MKKTILLSAAALACLLSCSKGHEYSHESEQEIVFKADGAFNADVSTKATEVTASNLSKIYVSASSGATGSESSLWSSVAFTKASDSYKGNKYWPNTDPTMHFYASNLSLTYTSSGANVNVQNNSTDVVCAYIATPQFQQVNTLTFNHVLARIGTCKILLPDGYQGSGLTVRITPKVSGKYNLATGRWSSTTDGNATTIATEFGTGGNSNDLYLIPGDYTITASYTLTRDAYTETLTKTATVSLSAGKINLISATLPEGNAKEIVFTVSVKSWTNNNVSAEF